MLFFYECNVDLTVVNARGNTLLHALVCREGPLYQQLVAEILEKAPALVNAKNAHGETPLHLACLTGCMHMVELLLNSNANPTEPTHDMKLPFHYAIESVHSSQLIESPRSAAHR